MPFIEYCLYFYVSFVCRNVLAQLLADVSALILNNYKTTKFEQEGLVHECEIKNHSTASRC